MSQKIIKLELPVVRVFLSAIVGVFLVGVFVLAWTEPGSAPPGGNVEAPVNVGASTQAKAGSFIVGGVAFEAYNDVYLSTISGRVGIGTASPLDKLEILTSDATPYSADMGSYQPEAHGLVIRNNVNLAGAGVYSGILFEAGDLGDQLMSGYIGLVDEGGVGEFTGKLVFGTRSGSDNIVERLAIDENGNVGIGTPNPGQKLTVAGTIESTSGGFKFPDGSFQTAPAASFDYQELKQLIQNFVVETGESVTAGDVGRFINGKIKKGGNVGSSLSFGSTYTFNPSGNTYVSASVLSPTRFVVAYQDSDGSARAVIGNVSEDTAISYGFEYS